MQIMSQQMTAAAQESNYVGTKQNPAIQLLATWKLRHKTRLFASCSVRSIPSYCGEGGRGGVGGLESKSNLHSHAYKGHSQATGHKLHAMPLFFTPPLKWSPSAATEPLKEENVSRMFKKEKGEKQIQTDGWREYRRCGWTDSSLRSKRGHNAEDFGVFDYVSPLISEKGRRHRNPPSCYMHQMPSVTQYLHVFSVYMLSLGWLLPHLLQMQRWPSFCGGIIKVSCESIVQGIKR